MIVLRDNASEVANEFRTTHWSVVLAAQQESPERHLALNALCQRYWYPLYAFVRRQGRNPQDAEDLTQSFFARVLARERLALARPEHGRFRSFLLASMKNFLANDWDWHHAIKRGGDREFVSLDVEAGEGRYIEEPAVGDSPESLFEKAWALTLIGAVLEQLRKDYVDDGRAAMFDAIQAYLSEDGDVDTYAALGATLGMSEGAMKMAVLRLRGNFRQGLRAAIAQTLGSPAEVEEELRYLFVCLGR